MSQIPLLYILHSGNLYGTERMALATAEGLADEFRPTIVAPPGAALAEARRMGFDAKAFTSARELTCLLQPVFAESRHIAVIATGLVHSLCAMALACVYRRQMAHLHIVHGGTDERLSYGRKSWLNRSSATLVAVSAFVKRRLLANGVWEDKIQVIENFLPEARTVNCRRRPAYVRSGIRQALVISRIDPIKRVDLLLDAMDLRPELGAMRVRILGTGWHLESLRERALWSHPNVTFAGFVSDVERELAESDLLIHTCPAEPFGLAILEAMAGRIPVVVPDQGGAGSLIEDGVTGFRFRADDSSDLAERLLDINAACACDLNRIVQNGASLLTSRFSPGARVHDYRALLHKGLS